MWVRIQQEPFDPGALSNQFFNADGAFGASVTFTGWVRSTLDKPIEALILEHHPSMAQKQIERFAREALERFELNDIAVVHRFGELKVGEVIVQVMAAAPHRQAAFDGANYVMDWLKTDAPFWKKEVTSKGADWVSHRAADDLARERWKK
jgi:molybdopterin synthase catalytic subunit